jgi:hypothetical protein
MSDSPYPICDHIKDNGERCGSPARRGQKLSHFHGRIADNTRLPGKPGYRLAVIDCVESIQITVAHVNQALLDGTLDAKTANTVFRGLGLVKSLLPITPNRSAAAHYARYLATAPEVSAPEPSTPPETKNSPVTNDANLNQDKKKRPQPLLSAPELAGLRKIVRQGPRHPEFARATRLLDACISSRSTA